MPRNVRNWWLEVVVDGRKHMVSLGPIGKNGGFHMKVWQRSNGSPVVAGHLSGDIEETVGGLSLLALNWYDTAAGRYTPLFSSVR